MSSQVKYTGGCAFDPLATGVGPACSLDERFVGDLAAGGGYGNGVVSVGGCVYDAR